MQLCWPGIQEDLLFLRRQIVTGTPRASVPSAGKGLGATTSSRFSERKFPQGLRSRRMVRDAAHAGASPLPSRHNSGVRIAWQARLATLGRKSANLGAFQKRWGTRTWFWGRSTSVGKSPRTGVRFRWRVRPFDFLRKDTNDVVIFGCSTRALGGADRNCCSPAFQAASTHVAYHRARTRPTVLARLPSSACTGTGPRVVASRKLQRHAN